MLDIILNPFVERDTMDFDSFVKAAYSSPRLSKNKTAEYIIDLVKSGEEPTLEDLAAIYRYMMPARASKLRKNIRHMSGLRQQPQIKKMLDFTCNGYMQM